MDQQTHFVSPDEIIEFLDQQTISEEKATGLRLLRRAAQTIEQLTQEREHHLNAIIERDQALELAEGQLARVNMQSMSDKLTIPSPDQAALDQAVQFSYALIGLSYTNGLPDWVVSGAQGIIEYGQDN